MKWLVWILCCYGTLVNISATSQSKYEIQKIKLGASLLLPLLHLYAHFGSTMATVVNANAEISYLTSSVAEMTAFYMY